MRFASLGSGSGGNGTLVRWDGGAILLDCGFSAREAELRLARLGFAAADLTAILVTHEHTDHIKGVAPLARRHRLPVYLTQGTWQSRDLGQLPDLRLITGYTPFELDGLRVTPVAVPHDAREPAQYVFDSGKLRLGILTDLGSITPHVEEHYQGCDALILEANHDRAMLASGAYPPAVKRRVGGQWGHLSNCQAAGFLARLDTHRLQHLVVAHISHQNNSLALAAAALAPHVEVVPQVTYACQNQGFGWLQIT